MTRILKAHDVLIERGGKPVAGPLVAQLEAGTITAICGPNGAGKSSLVMGLAGLIQCASGAVTLGDADLSALTPPQRARAIGYLPQGADIAWDVAVESLVALGRHAYSDASTSGRSMIQDALDACELNGLRRRRVSSLSGGEKARVLLARVLSGEPEWILADEPLAALDLGHQLHLIGHLRRNAQKGCGVVIVVHDLAIAMNHADRVLVLNEGALVADGAPDRALSPDIIADVWGVAARWLGASGERALSSRVG